MGAGHAGTSSDQPPEEWIGGSEVAKVATTMPEVSARTVSSGTAGTVQALETLIMFPSKSTL